MAIKTKGDSTVVIQHIVKCQHCYWYNRRGKDKMSCSDSGVLATSPACREFEVDYRTVPKAMRKIMFLMGALKTSELPLVAKLADIQRRINNKHLKVPYKIGDRVFYKANGIVYRFTIHYMDEEFVCGETSKSKMHFKVLHNSVTTKPPMRKQKPTSKSKQPVAKNKSSGFTKGKPKGETGFTKSKPKAMIKHKA